MEQMDSLLTTLPAPFVELCTSKVLTQKDFTRLVVDLSDKYSHFALLVEKRFSISLQENIEKSFSKMNFFDFRNGLALCYLSHFKYNTYYRFQELEVELSMMLDLEKRFSKFMHQADSSFFLLLFTQKLAFLNLKEQGIAEEFKAYNFSNLYDLVGLNPTGQCQRLDWLMVCLQSLLDIFEEDTVEIITEHKGDFQNIIKLFDPGDREKYIIRHLSYGHAIGSTQYFTDQGA